MPDDPAIARVREVRHRISKQFDHDPKKLVEYYMQLQERHKDRILLANLFPCDTAAMAALDSPGSCTLTNVICEAQFSAQGGSPTVSDRLLNLAKLKEAEEKPTKAEPV